MKVIKPLTLGALHKAYSFKFKHYFVSAPVVFFDMGISQSEGQVKQPDPFSPYGVLIENLQWPLVQSQLGTQIMDMVMPKPVAEIMLAGSAWNPEPGSDKAATAGIQMEEVEKRLTIIGNRFWDKGLLGYKLSEAESWESIFIHDQTAYGGEGFQDNQFGTGYVGTEKQIKAPNVEDSGVSIKRIGKNYLPAGFGTIDLNHSQRTKFNGNYKSKEWLEKHFPNLAPDTDFRLFQAARSDQQFKTYLTGDESYRLANLVKDHPLFEGKLPGVKPRSFVQLSDGLKTPEENFYEIPLNLDTVWLFPDINVGVAIWHGQIEVQQLDAQDVETSLLAYEAIQDKPRETEHYRCEMLKRLDLETAIESMSDDAPLVPLKTEAQLKAEQQEIEDEIAEQEAIQKEQQEQYLEEVKDANGGNIPPGFEAPVLEKSNVLVSKKALERGSFSAAPIMAEVAKQKAEAEKQQKEMEKQLAQAQALSDKQMKALSSQGTLDASAVKAFKDKGNVSDKIAELQDLSKNKSLDLDAEQMKMLDEQKFKAQQYSMTPVSEWPEDEYAQEKRAIFLNAKNASEPLAARNWSGADLSNLDLSGMNLSGCNLENCNLENSILDCANLAQCTLLGSKLTKTSFKKCNLVEANLSSTVAQFACFDGANLSQALLMKCNFENTTFKQCDMRLCVVFESRLFRCQFSGSQFTKLSMINSSAVDADFSTIEAEMFVAMDCNFNLSRFDNVKLQRCAYLECQFNVCSFAQSQLEKCQFSGGCELAGANMAQLFAWQCGYRRIDGKYWLAEQATFKECDLGDSDFHAGNFNQANLTRSVLSESRFVDCNFTQANLFTALLRTTLLENCQLRDTNFYQADALAALVLNSNFKAAENIEPLTERRWQRVYNEKAS